MTTVACPRCGLPCTLEPLERPGTYRLVDPDGGDHLTVCPWEPVVPLPPFAQTAPTPHTCKCDLHGLSRPGATVRQGRREVCGACRREWYAWQREARADQRRSA